MIYHVFANRSNIGDWLSAKGIQKLLPGQEITECLCDVPFIEETISTLSLATPNDLIIIGGGGLLMDYFIPFWEAFRPIADRVPFIIWGIGSCDIKNEQTLPPRDLIEEIVSKSRLCILRDELSRSYLTHCNLPEPVPCTSVNVIEPVKEPGKDLLHVVNYTTVGGDNYEVMREAAMNFAENHGIVYRETNNQIQKNSEKELAHVLSLYSRSGIILSSALHGCIIGVAMGLKVLAVSGDRKIEAFMAAVGLQDWVIDNSEVGQVVHRLNDVEQQASPSLALRTIRMQNEKVADRIQTIYQQLCEHGVDSPIVD